MTVLGTANLELFSDDRFRESFVLAKTNNDPEIRLTRLAQKKFREVDAMKISHIEREILHFLASHYGHGATLQEISLVVETQPDYLRWWMDLLIEDYKDIVELTKTGRYVIASYPYLLYYATHIDPRWIPWVHHVGRIAFEREDLVSLFMHTIVSRK